MSGNNTAQQTAGTQPAPAGPAAAVPAVPPPSTPVPVSAAAPEPQAVPGQAAAPKQTVGGETVEQALVRSESDESNKGREAAVTALHTVEVLGAVSSVKAASRVGFAAGRR